MLPPRIDMVFTYVDGAEPAYAARRAALRQALGLAAPERASWSRGAGEITYAVRSVLRAMPWIGTIHIVTDGQTPPVDADLMRAGRVRLVDHGAIIPERYRPVYASTIIESCLHRIPGLSDVWLYNNDDFLHGAALTPDDFLAPAADGGLRLRVRTVPALVRVAIAALSRAAPPGLPRANPYTAGIANAAWLLRRAGLSWRDIVFPRHVTQVYRSSTARWLEETFAAELDAARSRHFRGPGQLSWSTLAYSAECHRQQALPIRWRPLAGPTDAAFIDFDRYRSPAQLAAAWRRVSGCEAKFICINNIPEAEAPRLAAAMAARGLGGAAGGDRLPP